MSEEKIPKGWKKVKIKDITTIIGGGTPSTSIKEYYHGDIPWLSPVDLSGYNDKYIAKGRKNISTLGLQKSSARLLPKNSVLFSSRAPIGYVAIAKNEITTNQGFKSLIPSPHYDPSFAYYFLKHRKDYIESQASGTTFKEISGKKLGEIQFPLPPLPEQQRIVAKLDALFGHLDSLKEKLDRIPKLLKSFRQQVLTQAVTGELTKEWREGKGLGEWSYEKALDCCVKVQSGGTPKVDGFSDTGIPFLKVYNIVNNRVDFEYRPQFITLEAHNSKIKKSKSLPGDVLMNIVGPPLNKIAIVPSDYKEWNLNQAITLFRPKEYLINKFLYYFFCEGASVRSVHNETRGVVGQVNISLSQCRNFDIPVPVLEEQEEIVSRVDALFELADKIETRYQSLKAKTDQLPQAILAKAFRGELVEQEVKEYGREAGEGMEA